MKGYRKKIHTTRFDKIFFKNIENFLSKLYVIPTSDLRCCDKFAEFKAYFDNTKCVEFKVYFDNI